MITQLLKLSNQQQQKLSSSHDNNINNTNNNCRSVLRQTENTHGVSSLRCSHHHQLLHCAGDRLYEEQLVEATNRDWGMCSIKASQRKSGFIQSRAPGMARQYWLTKSEAVEILVLASTKLSTLISWSNLIRAAILPRQLSAIPVPEKGPSLIAYK